MIATTPQLSLFEDATAPQSSPERQATKKRASKIAKIKDEIAALYQTLSTEIESVKGPDRLPMHCPADIANLLMAQLAPLDQEELWIVAMDTRNRIMSATRLYTGCLNSSTVRIAEVFRQAISKNSAAIAVVHNHPSGDPSPSPEDVNLTRSLVQAGKLLDIEVVDHIVIGFNRFISLKEKGLGF